MTPPDRHELRHLRFGWWSLLAWLVTGLVLEALHGWKVSWYLAVGNETRRLLLTLAHAHGTLLALVQLAFAAALARIAVTGPLPRALRFASPCLIAAALLLPIGFVLGAIGIYGGSDPGPGILLVPVGASLLLVGVALTAVAMTRRPPSTGPAQSSASNPAPNASSSASTIA